jgi:hypothetical protein
MCTISSSDLPQSFHYEGIVFRKCLDFMAEFWDCGECSKILINWVEISIGMNIAMKI